MQKSQDQRRGAVYNAVRLSRTDIMYHVRRCHLAERLAPLNGNVGDLMILPCGRSAADTCLVRG